MTETTRRRTRQAKRPRAGGPKAAPEALEARGRQAKRADLANAMEAFLRDDPAEAKRRRREDAADVVWSIRRRGRAEEHAAKANGSLPRMRGSRRGQNTALQRAAAWSKAEGAVVPDDVALITEHLLSEGLGVDVGAIGKGRRGRGGHLSVVTVDDMRSAWLRAEFAAFAVKVLDAAHRFYRATRDAFPSRAALDAVLSERAQEMPPAELRAVLAFANILPRGALKVLGRERGRDAGGWAGNARVDVLVAGRPVARKYATVDQTRRVVVDLLAPEWLDILYRDGPRKVALALAAKVVGRSRAQVEHLADALRAGEARGSADAR